MTQPPVEGTIIAFDYGSKYLGVAVGQTVTYSASALNHLKMRDGGPPWGEIEALLQQWRPKLVVVGLPLNMDDTESEMSRRARRFANRLNGRFGITVAFQDERLSSFETKSRLSHGSEERKRGGAIDSLAAVVILEHWLSQQHR
jgi:putative Holliday junction resolvase